MAASVIFMAANDCFTNKQYRCLEASFVNRKRSFSFDEIYFLIIVNQYVLYALPNY